MILWALTLAAIAASSCTPNQRITESANQAGIPASTQSPAVARQSFAADLEAMRTAEFVFIYVFRRKDGAVLDAEDRRYAAQVIPQEMNRRVVSDEGKAIIVGSNFKMPDESLKPLAERFVLNDYSTGEAVPSR